MFTGFPEETERYFLDLRFHNDAAFFHREHDRYLRDVQTPFYDFITDMMPTLSGIDAAMEPRPSRCLSRIRRDTRFSRDKTPYRDHLWTYFHRTAEERYGSVGFWFEYGVERLSWGLTTWGENRPLMDRFRRELAAKPSYYMGLISGCSLESRHLDLWEDGFRRMKVPQNIPPALDRWYRAKSITLEQKVADFSLVGDRRIFVKVRDDYLALAPIYHMLRGMQDALLEEEERRTAASRTDTWTK